MSTFGVRRAMVRVREAIQDFHGRVRADFAPMKQVDVFNFTTAEDVNRFQITTDRVIGGRTDCAFSLKPYKSFTAGCFEGVIDFESSDPTSKGGFASFRTKPDERTRDLDAFGGVEMRVKTDGRSYIANFKSADHSAEQLWQVRINTPPSRWVTLGIPFKDLVLTRRGLVEAFQMELNKSAFNGFGILLADGMSGPFKFEIQYLRAVRKINPSEFAIMDENSILEQQKQHQALLESTKTPEQLRKDKALLEQRAKLAAARVEGLPEKGTVNR